MDITAVILLVLFRIVKKMDFLLFFIGRVRLFLSQTMP